MSKFEVTVKDLETGETGTRVVTSGDYVLIPFAPCYVDSFVHHATGTVQIVLKDHRPEKT